MDLNMDIRIQCHNHHLFHHRWYPKYQHQYRNLLHLVQLHLLAGLHHYLLQYNHLLERLQLLVPTLVRNQLNSQLHMDHQLLADNHIDAIVLSLIHI